MKTNNLIPILIILGLAVLFFFPNPESNIFLYLGTALFFIILIIFLIKLNKKK